MKFTIFQSSIDNQWWWQLEAQNKKIIADSAHGYSSARKCKAAIDTIKSESITAPIQMAE